MFDSIVPLSLTFLAQPSACFLLLYYQFLFHDYSLKLLDVRVVREEWNQSNESFS